MFSHRLHGAGPIWSAAIVATIVVAVALPACTSKSPEDKVREVIDKCQAAVKGHKPGGVMEHIAKDFRDNHGNSRDTLKAILLREMMTNKSLGIYITTTEVAVNGGEVTPSRQSSSVPAGGREAAASLKIVVTGSSGIVPERADGLRVKLKLREDDGKWIVTYADWTFSSGGE